ncbi:hypothetical protein [Paenirhodobacter sp.]|uniref:hypothetical protein n=1 Tax=Paenirhodobacter sp. TaxID=1965326 RepID=UPI003B3EE357
MMLLARRIPRFNAHLDHLADIISMIDAPIPRTSERVFSAEKALIQIQIEWENFIRGLILDSATGNFENSSGPITSRKYPRLRSREAAAHKLIETYPRRKSEPDWYLPDEAINAAIRLDVSNQHQIAAELGVTPWPIGDLRRMRNFIAHKSKKSALEIRKTGIALSSTRIDVLDVAFQYSSGGIKRYVDWINFAKGSAARLVA